MDIAELVRRAAKVPANTRYMGELDCPVGSRVSTPLLRELDAVAGYMSISRSDAIRTLLADSVARAYDLCLSQGPNAMGYTIESLKPRYLEDLSEGEQAAVRIHENQRLDDTLNTLNEGV